MRVFIAGVMQASNPGKGMVDQSYRRKITEAVTGRWPDVDVVDPLQLHPSSADYDGVRAKETLLELLDLAAASDLVVAYVPIATMGTALEMYVAFQRGVPIVAISPLAENWVVRSLSRRIYQDLNSFVAAVNAAATLADVS